MKTKKYLKKNLLRAKKQDIKKPLSEFIDKRR